MENFEHNPQSLVPIRDFFMHFWQGTYEFGGNEWEYNGEHALEEAKGFEKMLEGFMDTHSARLFFQVDPEDNTADTLVLEVRDYLGNGRSSVLQIINEFLEEFGTGDKLEFKLVGNHLYLYLWYD